MKAPFYNHKMKKNKKINLEMFKKKYRIDWWQLPPLLLELFFLTFILFYLGEFGLGHFLFITDGSASWEFFFNLSLFYMMTMFFLNGTLKSLSRFVVEKTK